MATKIKKFPTYMLENRNVSSRGFGKFYPRTNRNETLTLRGLVERVAFEQKVYSRDIIEGVIARLTTVMVEQLQSGQAVKWPGLGTFRVEIENTKYGVNASDILSGKANVRELIEGVHIRLIPEGAQGEDITAKAFADQCSFQNDGVKVFTVVGSGDDAYEVSSIVSMAEYRVLEGLLTFEKVFQGENQLGEDSEFDVGNVIQFPMSGKIANVEEGHEYSCALAPDNVHEGDTVVAGDNVIVAGANGSFSGTIKALNTTAGQPYSRKVVLLEDGEVKLVWSTITGTAPA